MFENIPQTTQQTVEYQNDMLISDTVDPKKIIEDIVDTKYQEDPFYICDLGNIVEKYMSWKEKMPRVTPFYGKYTIYSK